MAKNTRKMEEDSALNTTDRSSSKSGKNKRYTGNSRGARSNSRRKKPSPNERANSTSKNETLGRMNVESAGANSSLVFPSNSAAMQAFGNFTTTPGQNNFIANYNGIQRSATATDLPVNLDFTFNSQVTRTANMCVLGITPLLGATNSESLGLWDNPLMLAATNLKQYIDTSFGTKTSYAPQDLLSYLGGVAFVFPMIAEIKRDLRLAVTYIENQFPQFVPQGIFAALGIADDAGQYNGGQGAVYTARNLRSFIDELNQIIITFNRLPMPPELAIFGYNDYLFDNIYMDTEDIATAQLYAFKNDCYWLFREGVREEGATLDRIPFAALSVSAKLARLSGMVKALSALRSDGAAMLQNLFNAYGSRDTIQVPLLDINGLEPVRFVYDPNVLTMIENCVPCLGESMTISSFQATQYGFNQHVFINNPAGADKYFNLPLQFHKPFDSITHEDIGWALRLHPMFIEQKAFDYYTPTSTLPVHASHVTSDGYVGFGIVTSMSVVSINASGSFTRTNFTSRGLYDTAHWESWTRLLDFAARPLFVDYFLEERTEADDPYNYSLVTYTADRDVEVTYRLEDTQMHWTYLTINVWAANVNRNVGGSRMR